jgi:hypothetical protein
MAKVLNRNLELAIAAEILKTPRCEEHGGEGRMFAYSRCRRVPCFQRSESTESGIVLTSVSVISVAKIAIVASRLRHAALGIPAASVVNTFLVNCHQKLRDEKK